VLEVTQAAVWKILKHHREASGGYTPRVSRSSSKPSPEPAAPPASVSEPPVPVTVDVASLPPEAFYAHVVDQIEVAIQGARASRRFSAIAALRARQFAAYEMLTAARGTSGGLEDMSEDELVETLRADLQALPDELLVQICLPEGTVVQATARDAGSVLLEGARVWPEA